jgi:CRISPR system Cascade subunit CasD
LVAAAQGIRRTDSLESLLSLRFSVRVDQPGHLVRDFQTAQRVTKKRDGTTEWIALPLSTRYYMADAVYLALLEGAHERVTSIAQAIRRPQFPLYLGRRSCSPAGPIALGVFECDLDEALATLPWLASPQEQRRRRDKVVRLATVRDAEKNESGTELIRDMPISFDPNQRQYAWRSIVRGEVEIANPLGVNDPTVEHDPMSALGG